MVCSVKTIVKSAILAIATGHLPGCDPWAAAAYPFWRNKLSSDTLEATGRIVCANCHLAAKPAEVEVPQSVLPDTVFEAIVKIPYDTNVQQVIADGSKGGLNASALY